MNREEGQEQAGRRGSLRLVHREDNVEEKRHNTIGQNMGVRESIMYVEQNRIEYNNIYFLPYSINGMCSTVEQGLKGTVRRELTGVENGTNRQVFL